MELGGNNTNLLDPSAQEFYPNPLPSPIPPMLPPPFPPQFYYPLPVAPMVPPPPTVLPPPAEYVQPTWVTDDAVPTRGVVLSMVPRHITKHDVLTAMECFGAVRAADMVALATDGLVTVCFYDLRSAQAAVAEVREQHVRQQSRLGQFYGAAVPVPVVVAPPWEGGGGAAGGGVNAGRGLVCGQAVWAHFAGGGSGDDSNQATLVVVSPMPAGVSLRTIRETFEPFGAVKDVRESMIKPYNKFIEFFDTRDAARALSELNGKEMFGRCIVIEFARSAGPHSRRRNRSSHSHSYNPNFPTPPRLRASAPHNIPPQNAPYSILKRSTTASAPEPKRTSAGADSVSGSSSSSSSRRNKTGTTTTASTIITTTTATTTTTGSGSSGKNNSSSPSSSGASSSAKQAASSRKGWKGKSNESRFLFKESDDGQFGSPNDERTTVMIRNIPNKYSQKLLLNMLDNHCIHFNEQMNAEGEEPPSAYDFVYLPIDFSNKCNVGYGFVNLTSPQAAFRLYKAFHKQPWEVFNSRKICQVTYARLQGLEALKEHFKNSKFACDNDEYMPVVFSPPRDGKQSLTEPVAIGGRELPTTSSSQQSEQSLQSEGGDASSTTTSTHAPSDLEELDDQLVSQMGSLSLHEGYSDW